MAASNSEVEFSVPHILEELRPMAMDWYELGVKLNVERSKLNDISRECLSMGRDRCMEAVLSEWIEYDDAGRNRLADALEAIGREDIAQGFRRSKSTSPDNQVMEEGDSDNHTGVDQSLSASSSSRSVEVLRNCSELQEKFATLVSSLKSELSLISLSKIRRFVTRELKGFSYQKRPSSIDQIFSSAQNHFCFLNHSLIEAIISEFLPSSIIGKKLVEYKEELKYFTNLAKLKDLIHCEMPKMHLYGGIDFIHLTLTKCWANLSLENIHKLLSILFAKKSNALTHISIDEEKSFCITWLVPKGIIPDLASISRTKVAFMSRVGIITLTVGQELVFQQHHSKAEIAEKVLNNTLINASISGEAMKVSLLLALGSDPNCSTRTGVTPLMLACKQGRLKVVELLLKANADINQSNENGNTALMAASSTGRVEIVKMLIAYNANLHCRGTSQHTALSMAALRDHIEVAGLLLWVNANPNVQTENGWTPLMYAASNGSATLAKTLLSCGACIETQRADGGTALSDATNKGHDGVVRVIKAYQILQSKSLSLEESPSPGTIRRRMSTPSAVNTEHLAMKEQKTETGVGLRSLHSTTTFPVSQSVPRSIFRPTARRSVNFHSSSKKFIRATRH